MQASPLPGSRPKGEQLAPGPRPLPRLRPPQPPPSPLRPPRSGCPRPGRGPPAGPLCLQPGPCARRGRGRTGRSASPRPRSRGRARAPLRDAEVAVWERPEQGRGLREARCEVRPFPDRSSRAREQEPASGRPHRGLQPGLTRTRAPSSRSSLPPAQGAGSGMRAGCSGPLSSRRGVGGASMGGALLGAAHPVWWPRRLRRLKIALRARLWRSPRPALLPGGSRCALAADAAGVGGDARLYSHCPNSPKALSSYAGFYCRGRVMKNEPVNPQNSTAVWVLNKH